MSSSTLLLVGVAAILAALSGWLVPIIFKSKRPYGLLGDILVCVVTTAVMSFLAAEYLLPAIGFGKGWIFVLGSIGDPLAFGWIALWVMRKIKQ